MIKELHDVITQNNIANWGYRATFLQGKLLTTKGQLTPGLAFIRQALEATEAAGAQLARTWMASEAVVGYIRAENFNEARKLLTQALEVMDGNEERNWESELRRLEGELVVAETTEEPMRAEAHFRSAIGIARSQSAKSLELRASTSLARLWRAHGKRHEACGILAPIYDWFTEGFDTPDLVAAKTLLHELS